MSKNYDLIIVGGGPAGTTIGSMVKRYKPDAKVLLLERAKFPRHHVGESLLAGASPVLREMGAYDRINNYGFIEKSGATYIWGHDRKPWGFDFDRVVKPLIERGIPLPETYTKGWQVRRGEYDHELLKHAADMGVEVMEETKVTKVLRADDGDKFTARVIGVEYKGPKGIGTAHCDWLMDCTGQDALLGHDLKLRKYSDDMNNYALFGYWENYTWHEEWMGLPTFTRIFIATCAAGWIWCIPASPTVLSIGLVTNRDTLRDFKGKPDELYLQQIQTCPEISAVLNGANMTRISADQNRDVVAIQDWSYESRQMFGAGWAMCGDAAGFVDPILSSGVMLCHELGQKAAYTINTCMSATSDAEIQNYWNFYQETYRTYLRAYREMAQFWYGTNFAMESWWWQAQRTLAHENSGYELSNAESFMRLASGYATRTESLSLFGSYPLHEAQQLVDGLFGVPYDPAPMEANFNNRALRLNGKARVTDGLYYFYGQVRKTRRVSNADTRRYIDLHPAEDVLLRLLDGQHSYSDIDKTVKEIRANGNALPVRDGLDLLVQLDGIGVLG